MNAGYFISILKTYAQKYWDAKKGILYLSELENYISWETKLKHMESELLYNVTIGIIKYMLIFYFYPFLSMIRQNMAQFASKTSILARKYFMFLCNF